MLTNLLNLAALSLLSHPLSGPFGASKAGHNTAEHARDDVQASEKVV